jgi:DNA polymerase I-like protein with 3'-5' exonuclease and polymerase domains
MAIIFQTGETDFNNLQRFESDAIYNGLDCCLTEEIKNVQLRLLKKNPYSTLIYKFERALQAPILYMNIKGVKIDRVQCIKMIAKITKRQTKIREFLNEIGQVVWGKDINPNSPAQLKTVLYDIFKLPLQYVFTKGVKKITTNENALQNLVLYIYARPLIKCILALRECTGKLSVLKVCMQDKRLKSFYNIPGTVTGRLASSSSVFGEGTNAQNITEELRIVQIADVGKKLCYIDLEQAESRDVAYLSQDIEYITACEGGDLHTLVAMMIWPGLPWNSSLIHNKKIAKTKFYRHWSYRDMGKRGGHATNYYGQARNIAKNLKVPGKIMVDFQKAYFTAFNGLPEWHRSVIQQLQTKGYNITPFGRFRQFFGRVTDASTIREAINHEPQSICADYIDLGLWLVWKKYPNIQILGQVHDAILFQYNEKDEDSIIPTVRKCLDIKLKIHDRILRIPSEAATGWNCSKYSKDNLNGLKVFTTHDTRTRIIEGEYDILKRKIT